MSGLHCPACGEPMRHSDTKLGGLSVSCGACGFQGWGKSPKASAAMRERLARIEPPAVPTAKPPAGKPAAPAAPAVKRISDKELFGD